MLDPHPCPFLAPQRLTALVLAAAGFALVGCAGSGGSSHNPPAKAAAPVAADAFVETSPPTPATEVAGAAAPTTPVTAIAAAGNAPPPRRPVNRPAPPPPSAANPDAALSTTSMVGSPTPAANSAPASDRPVVLEALVGQVNGRAVFASEIIEPLDDQLRARSQELAAKRRPRTEFRAEAAELLKGELHRVIHDELVLAEARASLTPEQRQGVFYFLNKIQEDLVSQQRGSAVAADEEARANFGGSLRSRAQDQLDRQLVQLELQQRINPRVQVPWRSQQLQYEKDFEKYNPRPVAKYRLIQVLKQSDADIEKVKSSLASGTPFVDVALSDVNLLARADDATHTVKLTGEPEQELFASPALNSASRDLTVGQITGPIDSGRTVTWILFESVDQAPAVSLYDAQLTIESDLRQQRFSTELRRYIARLSNRGNFSRIEEMQAKLLEIVEQRYPGGPVQ